MRFASNGKEISAINSPLRNRTLALSPRGLTILLGLMCLIPSVTIFALWRYMPPVYEGQLVARVHPVGLPDQSFYMVDYRHRPPVVGGEIAVMNTGDQDWTNINIQINGHYQIYDHEPIRVGEERNYLLERFVSRTGARFSLRYNPLRSVRVYARRPGGDRATYYQTFETND